MCFSVARVFWGLLRGFECILVLIGGCLGGLLRGFECILVLIGGC